MNAQRLRGVSLPPGIEPEFITINQTQLVTGLGRTKIYELLAEGILDSITIGKRRLVRLSTARGLSSVQAA